MGKPIKNNAKRTNAKKILTIRTSYLSKKKFSMKLLIGILYTIENEFEQCIAAIQSQTHQNFDYFVVEKLPNKEAHETLYNRFMNNADRYDFFIKIDADMVLVRKTFFEEVIKKMQQNPQVDNLEIAVYDFFTDRLIYGLHSYKNTVKWNKTNEIIFVDKNTQKINHLYYNKADLAPAAYHCPNPSKFQAFHFGLHKAVKVTQHTQYTFDYWGCKLHWDNILKIKKHYQKTKNNLLAYALAGAYIAIKQKLQPKHVNFDNCETKKIFNKQTKNEKKLIHKINTLNFILFFIPNNILLQIIILKKHFKHGKKNGLKQLIKALTRNE